MKKHILSIAAFLLCVGSISATPKYKKQSVPVEQRVEDLLKRMTLEEKIAQMQHIHAKHYNNDGTVDFERLRQNTGGLSRGCMEAFPYTLQQYVNAVCEIQTEMLEEMAYQIGLEARSIGARQVLPQF